jgi:hypothetical protein
VHTQYMRTPFALLASGLQSASYVSTFYGRDGFKHGHRRLLVKPEVPGHSNFFASDRSSFVLRTAGLRWRRALQQASYAGGLAASTFDAGSHRRPKGTAHRCTTMANRQLTTRLRSHGHHLTCEPMAMTEALPKPLTAQQGVYA